MRKNGYWVAAVLVLFIGFGLNPAAAQDVIKFGIATPLTAGDYKSGQINVQTAELFIEQINAKGGLLGKKVALVKADHEANPRSVSPRCSGWPAKRSPPSSASGTHRSSWPRPRSSSR